MEDTRETRLQRAIEAFIAYAAEDKTITKGMKEATTQIAQMLNRRLEAVGREVELEDLKNISKVRDIILRKLPIDTKSLTAEKKKTLSEELNMMTASYMYRYFTHPDLEDMSGYVQTEYIFPEERKGYLDFKEPVVYSKQKAYRALRQATAGQVPAGQGQAGAPPPAGISEAEKARIKEEIEKCLKGITEAPSSQTIRRQQQQTGGAPMGGGAAAAGGGGGGPAAAGGGIL